jgi:hypothetical protein
VIFAVGMRGSEMPVSAVTDTLDWAVRPARVLVQAVLDGVPGNRRSGEFLGCYMDLAGL